MKLVTGDSFTFTIEAPELLSAINSIASLAPDLIVVTIDGDKQHIIGRSKTGTVVALPLKCESSKGQGAAVLDRTILGPMLSKRKTAITFDYDGSEIKLKAKVGKFDGTLKTSPLLEEDAEAINSTLSDRAKDGAVITDAVAASIWATVDAASITDPLFGEVLTRYIVIEKGRLTVSSFDNIHMGIVETKVKDASDMRIALTDEYIAAVRKVHGNDKVRLSMKDNAFVATSPKAFLSMPPLQTEEGAWDTVKQFVERPVKAALTVKLRAKRLSMVLENLCSIYEAGASIQAMPTAKSIKFSIKTSYGQLADQMPCEEIKGEAKFHLEPYGLRDLVRLLPENDLVTWEVTPGQQYKFTCEALGAYYLGSLHE